MQDWRDTDLDDVRSKRLEEDDQSHDGDLHCTHPHPLPHVGRVEPVHLVEVALVQGLVDVGEFPEHLYPLVPDVFVFLVNEIEVLATLTTLLPDDVFLEYLAKFSVL